MRWEMMSAWSRGEGGGGDVSIVVQYLGSMTTIHMHGVPSTGRQWNASGGDVSMIAQYLWVIVQYLWVGVG